MGWGGEIVELRNLAIFVFGFSTKGVLSKIIYGHSRHLCDGRTGVLSGTVKIEFKIDSKQVSDALSDAARSQMPFVKAKMLTALAKGMQERLKSRLPQVFDRPTPFTQRGVFIKPADKTTQVAEVFFPESQEDAGRATREYIRPGAQGTSARRQKKTEYVLSRMGFLPAGWVTVPGSFYKGGGKLDQYGNINGSTYKNIIRGLGMTTSLKPRPLSGRAQKRVAAMGVESEYFAVGTGTNKLGKNGGWLPGGVYKRTGPGGRKLAQYLLFVRKASYKQRLNLRTEAKAYIDTAAQGAFDDAVALVRDKFKAR